VATIFGGLESRRHDPAQAAVLPCPSRGCYVLVCCLVPPYFMTGDCSAFLRLRFFLAPPQHVLVVLTCTSSTAVQLMCADVLVSIIIHHAAKRPDTLYPVSGIPAIQPFESWVYAHVLVCMYMYLLLLLSVVVLLHIHCYIHVLHYVLRTQQTRLEIAVCVHLYLIADCLQERVRRE